MNATIRQDPLPGVPTRLVAALARARAINLTLVDVLKRAGVGPGQRSTVYRWLDGRSDPKLGVFNAMMATIERQLALEEERLRAMLLADAAE